MVTKKVVIVIGVSGVGKTTVGKALAQSLRLPFYDADDFHTIQNKEKMSNGIALTDEDRQPWLDDLAKHIQLWITDGAVLGCSALKQSYRERLIHLIPEEHRRQKISFVYLKAAPELVASRLASRSDHFFDPSLISSQFDILEPPQDVFTIEAANPISIIIDQIELALALQNSHIGLLGLGVMGKSLARNFADKGIRLSLFNRHVPGKEEQVAKRFIDAYPELNNAKGFENLHDFVNSIPQPRTLFLMVPAGAITDVILDTLIGLLSKGDCIIDGGNSHFQDTQRRSQELNKRGIHFFGVGVSGGETGALKGPALMPGGPASEYHRIRPILESIAAKDAKGKRCCHYIGKSGAGHFVKMIHNGIEYGEMQLITEMYDILRFHMNMELEAIAALFDRWNLGKLKSYLLEISAVILRTKEDNRPLLDLILDTAAQKGTGGWSTTAALALGQPFDTISSAVMARNLSSQKMLRISAQTQYGVIKKSLTTISVEDIEKSYHCARLINHAIGFETIKSASQRYDWDIDLARVAHTWTSGCIIRSSLMEELVSLFDEDPMTHLLLQPAVVTEIKQAHSAFAKTVSAAIQANASIPTMSAALHYFNGIVTGNSAANLIQAQRDFFGAHTYKRVDKYGSFHTQWLNTNTDR